MYEEFYKKYTSKFDKYVNSSICNQSANTMVAIVISAKYQGWGLTNNGFSWRTNKTIKAY